ncbi:hypothetical protein [Blautia sp.]
MALPTDGQNANELDEVTEVPAGKELIFFDPTTNAGGIITLENLTKQILNGIASQAFNLDAGQMTILQALNSLNGKSLNTDFANISIILTSLDDAPYGISFVGSTATELPGNLGGFLIKGATGSTQSFCLFIERNITHNSNEYSIYYRTTHGGGGWNIWNKI